MSSMREATERLRAAWYVMRGWSVVRGVSFRYGEVDIHRHDLLLSGKSKIEHARICTQVPVTIRWPDHRPDLPVTGETEVHEVRLDG